MQAIKRSGIKFIAVLFMLLAFFVLATAVSDFSAYAGGGSSKDGKNGGTRDRPGSQQTTPGTGDETQQPPPGTGDETQQPPPGTGDETQQPRPGTGGVQDGVADGQDGQGGQGEQPTAPAPNIIAEERLTVRESEMLALIANGTPLEFNAEGVNVTIPVVLLAELTEGGSAEAIIVDVAVTAADASSNDLFVTRVTITVGDETAADAGVPFTVAVSMDAVDLDGVNTNRLVAVQEDGTLIGGRFDREAGLFLFEAPLSGEFTITYKSDLRRLTLHPNSPEIVDLAGNEPTRTMDVLPMLIDGRTMLPVRFVAYSLGAEVGWDSDARQATIDLDGRSIAITPGEPAPGMDVPPQVIDGRTMVPLRFISEFFGAVVDWCPTTRNVTVIR